MLRSLSVASGFAKLTVGRALKRWNVLCAVLLNQILDTLQNLRFRLSGCPKPHIQPERYVQFGLNDLIIDFIYYNTIIIFMLNKMKYFFIILIFPFISCESEFYIVEMIEQKKGLVLDVEYEIETINGSIAIKYKNFQKIYPKGRIVDIRCISGEYSGEIKRNYDIEQTIYYSQIDKKIKIYFFLLKEGIETIDSLNKTFFIEPFENFEGYYTIRFVYDNMEYQIVSLNPKINIEEFVEEFDFIKLNNTGITQCKIIGQYFDKAKQLEEINNREFHSSQINYFFPEDNNPIYINYTLRLLK